jgi:hypothetical protein
MKRLETTVITPYTSRGLLTVKTAALYFDSVDLQQRTLLEIQPLTKDLKASEKNSEFIVTRSNPLVDDHFLDQIRPLVEANVVVLRPEMTAPDLGFKMSGQFSELFHKNQELILSIPKDGKGRVEVHVDSEAVEIHRKIAGPLHPGATFYPSAVFSYYEGLLIELAQTSLAGETVVTGSDVLHSLLQLAAKQGLIDVGKLAGVFPGRASPSLVMDVIQTSVLDVSNFEVQDILEARHHLRDELSAFRAELARLEFELVNEFGIEKVHREGKAISDARLVPRVKDMERKIAKSRIATLRNLFEETKNPSSYVPLVASAFSGIPLEIAVLLSTGLISGRVALDTWEQHKEVANDGLFYLVKLRRLAGGKETAGPVELPAEMAAVAGALKERGWAWPFMVELIRKRE